MSVGSLPKCRRRSTTFWERRWMHCLVGVSHFVEYGTNRPLIVREMLTMSKNSLLRNDEEYEKVIRNPYADPDHHQKLTSASPRPIPTNALVQLQNMRNTPAPRPFSNATFASITTHPLSTRLNRSRTMSPPCFQT